MTSPNTKSSTTHYSLHCDISSHFLLEIQEICVLRARLPQIISLCELRQLKKKREKTSQNGREKVRERARRPSSAYCVYHKDVTSVMPSNQYNVPEVFAYIFLRERSASSLLGRAVSVF